MANTTVPSNLSDLFKLVKKAADSFGFDEGVNGQFRDCVSNRSDGTITNPDNENANFWFGYIREDEPDKSKYSGLSFVIFPERQDKGNKCLIAIGIGSSSIGQDVNYISNPGFKRSFTRLTKKEASNAKFFFKLRFDDMETSTPGLQDEIESVDSSGEMVYDNVFINTITKYNADAKKDSPGMLPAAFIVDYTNSDGWNLIIAWLAQYAKWRNWDKCKNGADKKKGYPQNIQDAIQQCRNDVPCPDVKSILLNNRYIVLQGAPGCGKTWTANEISQGDEFKDNVFFIQFHAETTYSDFIYGIRPVLNGTNVAYKGEKGVLLQAIDRAKTVRKDDKKVLLIIDEINRANLANVLGPVFYLFEPNAERKHKLVLGKESVEINIKGNNKKTIIEKDLEYSEIPSNLYVLATMNTADKSLAVVDFALRRRFTWVTLRPHRVENEKSFDDELFNKVDGLFSKYATDEELNLQPGQSYFMDKKKRTENILYGLMPLMKEYFAEGFLLSAKEEFAQLFYDETGEFMYE